MQLDSDLLARLVGHVSAVRTEADIQSDIKMLLLSAPDLLPSDGSSSKSLQLEEQLGDGSRRRIDISLGSSVIEVKRALTTEAEASDYIDQLRGYVQTRMEQTKSRYNGILSDGRSWWLFEIDPATGKFPLLSKFELTTPKKGADLVAWLQAVLAMPAEIAPKPDAIEDVLGADSPGYAQDKAFLEGMYRSVSHDPTTSLKRELWARLLRSALGTGFEDQEKLFLDHTLLSIEAAAIGHAVMGINLAKLATDPAAMLSGEFFRDAGIYNVVEADFFDWVLAVPQGEKFLRQIIRRINIFDWSKTEHDVLKVLYESIINPETRKGAGEYYTPDWLAEGIVEKALTKPLEQRALDPSCGSGTFVYHLVRRIINAGEEADWGNRRILKHVQEHVFGLDIHPVSVSLARITYLLALGERLEAERDDIWVPVHLGDSIQWHQPADHDESRIQIKIEGVDITTASTGAITLFDVGHILAFPLAGIDDPGTFDRLVTDMTDRAKIYIDAAVKKPSIDPILTKFGITDAADRETLRSTFNILCDLNAEGRDSIWGYFVRNQVRPLWLSMNNRRMDVLVGNPPWVAYRHMTEDMQKQFKAFSQARNLWHGAKVSTNQDLVGLFLVRAVEKYLKNEGHFAFVTPRSVLNGGQYKGLRQGDWENGLFSEFTEVWDLSKVRPIGDLFPVPSAVVYGKKHMRTAALRVDASPRHGFPERAMVVVGKRDKSGWKETKKAVDFIEEEIAKISDPASPYRQTVFQGAVITPRFLFCVSEKATTGRLGQSRGMVHVESKRTSQEKQPWKNLPSLSGVIEKRFIYDVHLGATIAPFKKLTPWKAVLPIDNGKIVPEENISEYAPPGFADWWAKASKVWERNKTKQSRLSLQETLDYLSKLSKQLGGTSLRVVYTKSGTKLASTIIDDPRIIIDHKLYWLPARSVGEARYLTSVLNAPITTKLVSKYQSLGLYGPRDFDTYLWQLEIPLFDSSNGLHQRLVSLAEECEKIANAVPEGSEGFQKIRGKVRQKLDEAGLQQQLNEAVADLLEHVEEDVSEE